MIKIEDRNFLSAGKFGNDLLITGSLAVEKPIIAPFIASGLNARLLDAKDALASGSMESVYHSIGQHAQETKLLEHINADLLAGFLEHPLATTFSAIAVGMQMVEQHGIDHQEGESKLKSIFDNGLVYPIRALLAVYGIQLFSSYINAMMATKEFITPDAGDLTILTLASLSVLKSGLAISKYAREAKYKKSVDRAAEAKAKISKSQEKLTQILEKRSIPESRKGRRLEYRDQQNDQRGIHANIQNEHGKEMYDHFDSQIDMTFPTEPDPIPNPRLERVKLASRDELSFPKSVKNAISKVPRSERYRSRLERFYKTHFKRK
jgi:hypothetical protein